MNMFINVNIIDLDDCEYARVRQATAKGDLPGF